MNERIQELAEQAGIHFGRSATLDGNNIARFVTTSDMEKFAELIVGECVSQLNIPNVPGPISAGLNLGKIAIKQHFGVAE
jgi:hypothetical protein